MRLGIFGGSFDPPHLGHLILAESARSALRLDQVLFVPAADPPHKRGLPMTPAVHRVEMVRRAIANNADFALSDLDLTRPGPHYTVELLRLMGSAYPSAELYFLMGGDSLRDLPTWRDPAGIIAQVPLAVMARPGAQPDMAALETLIPGLSQRVMLIDAPEVAISATLIRDRCRAGQSIRYLVPDSVAQYITAQAIYEALPS